MKTTPNLKHGLVRDVLDMIDRGMTTDQIIAQRELDVREFPCRDGSTNFKVYDRGGYPVSRLHKKRNDAIENALYDPYNF